MPRAPVCPFFGRAKKENLTCLMNGADTQGDELLLNFPTQMCRVRYWVSYCCGDWKQCTLAASLWEEFELEKAKPPKKSAKTAGVKKPSRAAAKKKARCS